MQLHVIQCGPAKILDFSLETQTYTRARSNEAHIQGCSVSFIRRSLKASWIFRFIRKFDCCSAEKFTECVDESRARQSRVLHANNKNVCASAHNTQLNMDARNQFNLHYAEVIFESREQRNVT